MKSIRFGFHPAQSGELHLPDRRRPAVVCLFHGGFWRMPYAADQMTPLAADLARRGFAAWNLEYRRLGEGGGWPATFDDVSAGIDYLAHLVDDGIELNMAKVATVGHSAGGQLALWAAARAHRRAGAHGVDPRVRVAAVVGQAPITDLSRAHALGLGRDVVAELLGGPPSDVPERYAAASPRALLPVGVPQLLVHGERDEVVPVAMSRDYVRAAQTSGDAITLIEPPGIDHFEHLEPEGAAWREVVNWLERTLHPSQNAHAAQGEQDR